MFGSEFKMHWHWLHSFVLRVFVFEGPIGLYKHVEGLDLEYPDSQVFPPLFQHIDRRWVDRVLKKPWCFTVCSIMWRLCTPGSALLFQNAKTAKMQTSRVTFPEQQKKSPCFYVMRSLGFLGSWPVNVL